MELRSGAPRDPGRRARRWSAARPSWRRASGGRRSGTASSSTTTRMRRTGPSRRPGRCGRHPTRVCRCRSSGTRSPIAIRRRSPWSRRRRAWPHAATPRPRSTPLRDRSIGFSRCPPPRRRPASATLPGRRTTRSSETSRRASCPHVGRVPSAAEPAETSETRSGRRRSSQPLITVAKAQHQDDALAGLERWKARYPRAAGRLQVDDVLVDRCAAGRRRGRASGSTCATFPKPTVRRKSRRIPTTIRGATPTRSGARDAGAEDALELVGGRHLQLIVAAVARTLVRAPAHELRGVAEARALHVVVRDLAGSLGPQRLPAQVLASVPAAARPGHALPRRCRLRLRLGPVPPGMAVERVRAQRRQLGDELLCERRC